MSHTQRHVAFAVAWFFGLPVVAFVGVIAGAIPFSEFNGKLLSAAWVLGLIVAFGSWSFRDAPAHGKSIYYAAAFTASWFLLFVLAAFPYLLVTRGLREGSVASLKFLALCLACLVGWVALFALLGGAQAFISKLLGQG